MHDQKRAVVEIVSYTRTYEPGKDPELVFVLRRASGHREPLAGLVKNRVDKRRAGFVGPGRALAELAASVPAHPTKVRRDGGGDAHSAPVRFALACPEHAAEILAAFPAAVPYVEAEQGKARRAQPSSLWAGEDRRRAAHAPEPPAPPPEFPAPPLVRRDPVPVLDGRRRA